MSVSDAVRQVLRGKGCLSAGRIGSLKEGMKADILVSDGSSPAMLAAAVENTLAAIVLHTALEKSTSVVKSGTALTWKDVVKGVLGSRLSIKEKLKPIPSDVGEEWAINMFMDRQTLLER
ncbi:Uu.00g117190.m01.CDS01 [Anthostomella pinea]|uniref:Uu.00g117190.m01.CDS01 n=1 Tax=Anthostomella pinea TaxID=933095 RepID=A0AAI8VG72_9PEZI|nr:Uu.00g117190.m01.CDS01 [Anthostomella pinea]